MGSGATSQVWHDRRKEAAMIHLDLNRHDAETLKAALESYLSDLRMEIAGTDSMDFRDSLKGTKATLRKIANELASQAEVVPR
jgi:hypothetical protein